MNIDMNDKVRVILTQTGADLLNEAERQAIANGWPGPVRGHREGDEYSDQLWALLQDLGPCWAAGNEPPFAGNLMHVDVDPELTDCLPIRCAALQFNDCDDATAAHVDDCNGELA